MLRSMMAVVLGLSSVAAMASVRVLLELKTGHGNPAASMARFVSTASPSDLLHAAARFSGSSIMPA